MITKTIAITILFFCISCSGQLEKEINTVTKTEQKRKFDIENFKKSWNKGGAFFSLSDGSKVEQYKSAIGFDEFIKKPAPVFLSEYNTYNEEGNLQSSTTTFSNVVVGKSFEYGKNGEIISENNADAKFKKIKYTDILQFLKKKHHLNLNTGEGWYLNNGNFAIEVNFDESNLLWTIRSAKGIVTQSKNSPTGQALKSDFYYEIDGNSGKVLKD